MENNVVFSFILLGLEFTEIGGVKAEALITPPLVNLLKGPMKSF